MSKCGKANVVNYSNNEYEKKHKTTNKILKRRPPQKRKLR